MKTKKMFLVMLGLLTFGLFFGMDNDTFEPIRQVGEVTVEVDATDYGPVYAMALTGLNIDDVIAQLGDYSRKYNNEIQQLLRQTIQFENEFNPVPGVTDEYVTMSSTNSELVQAWQCDWTPKGTTTVDAKINKVRQMKVDYELDCLDDIYRSYIAFMADEKKNRKDWPISRYIVEKHLIPGIAEEIDNISYNGEYLAPTAGTAGASINSADGMKKTIEDAVIAGDITPIVTGAITETNIVEKLRLFYKSLPIPYRNVPGKIYMSESRVFDYWNDYQNIYGANNNYTGKDNLRIPNTRKVLVGINAMEGSDKIIHSTSRNLLKMYDKKITPTSFEFDKDKRKISVFTDWKRGWGWRHNSEMFVNDQP